MPFERTKDFLVIIDGYAIAWSEAFTRFGLDHLDEKQRKEVRAAYDIFPGALGQIKKSKYIHFLNKMAVMFPDDIEKIGKLVTCQLQQNGVMKPGNEIALREVFSHIYIKNPSATEYFNYFDLWPSHDQAKIVYEVLQKGGIEAFNCACSKVGSDNNAILNFHRAGTGLNVFETGLLFALTATEKNKNSRMQLWEKLHSHPKYSVDYENLSKYIKVELINENILTTIPYINLQDIYVHTMHYNDNKKYNSKMILQDAMNWHYIKYDIEAFRDGGIVMQNDKQVINVNTYVHDLSINDVLKKQLDDYLQFSIVNTPEHAPFYTQLWLDIGLEAKSGKKRQVKI